MYVKVTARSGAGRASVKKERDGAFRISVKEPAAGGLANERIGQLLAAEFGLHTGAVRLIRGHRSPSKIFEIYYNSDKPK